MIDLVYCLTNFLFCDIPLLYYYINPWSSIIFCYSCEDIYLSLGISLWCLFEAVSKLLCSEVFEAFLIPSWLDFIIYQITSWFCCFLNYSFWNSFKCICCKFDSMIKKFLAVCTTNVFTNNFANILSIFLAKDKNR